MQFLPNKVEDRGDFGIKEEIWWDYPKKIGYQLSTWGQVRSVGRYENRQNSRVGKYKVHLKGKVLKPWKLSNGYLQVCLTKEDEFKKTIHVLVLETFIGPCPEGMECRHLDGNRTNNKLNNLCWGTGKENAADRERHGTGPSVTTRKGDDCPYAKLTSEIVRKIKRMYASGDYSQRILGEMFDLHQVTISNIVMGKIWKTA